MDADARRTFDDGLVLILRETHDALDVAVSDAYGWPHNLAGEETLARLLALNKARSGEEARGNVAWLRPDYQIPRLGTAQDKAELDLGTALPATAAKAIKPPYPNEDAAQIIAVMAALAQAPGMLDASTLAANFRQGKKVAGKIAAVLAAIARTGHASTSDGRNFRLRRAA